MQDCSCSFIKQMKTQLTKRSVKGYGWVPDLPDKRDFYLSARYTKGALPKSVDLSDNAPSKVYDQGNLGSCTGNAIAAAIEFDLKKQGLEVFTPSRLFIYYNERVIEHSVSEDAGAMIRDGIKSVRSLGAPPESIWPYSVGKFADKPGKDAYKEAKLHQALSYMRVKQTESQMKSCLASGLPFTLGFAVYDSFESDEVARTGTVNMPASNEALLGGHAVLCIGYDDATQRFLIRNSWGPSWGNNGNFTLPYEYLLNADLADDFWAIKVVEGVAIMGGKTV
jgi:C1A family cysteine protease